MSLKHVGFLYLSAGGHFDLRHLLRPVSEHVNVHPETNEEVLLCRLQEVFQEHDIPVQKSRSRVKAEMLRSGRRGNHSVKNSHLLSNSEHGGCDADVLWFVDAVE